MSDFKISEAKADNTPIIMGLTAPSGAGKTYSALTLAFGICDILGGKPGIIDTEGRRALRYADRIRYPEFGDFLHMDFQPPFASDRYADAIRAMGTALGNKGTIIVDSMSHEHEGPGGYLEFHESELDRMAGQDWKKREKMTFTAWIKPAAARRRLINSFLQTPMNFIFCFRAKEKIKPISGGQPVQLGFQAIAGDEFVYEMITRFLLPPGAAGMPDWSEAAFKHGAAKRDRQDAALFPDDARITREMGRAVARAYGAATPVPRQQAGTGQTTIPAEERMEHLKRFGDAAAAVGTDALKDWFLKLTPNDKRMIEDYKNSTLKAKAEEADKKSKEAWEN
jgi:hypothetical protein